MPRTDVAAQYIPLGDGELLPTAASVHDSLEEMSRQRALKKGGKSLKELKAVFGEYQCISFWLSLVAVLAAASLAAYGGYSLLQEGDQATARSWCFYGSIPVVACLFTWFHIWLALQMMFLPLEFVGCCEYQNTGQGLGWQGVVPRKCKKMARKAYENGRKHIMGPGDTMRRVDPVEMGEEFAADTQNLIGESLQRFCSTRFPTTYKALPQAVREEIAIAGCEALQEVLPDFWDDVAKVLDDPEIGIDNAGMFVKAFSENKTLLNNMFQKMGHRELKFIEHSGAVMGFVCGLFQLVAFNYLNEFQRQLFLPGSGFFLGIFTNFMAIQMCFNPIDPWIVCGMKVQGLFLKRQHEVCETYSGMLTEHFFTFDKMVEYLMSLEATWKVLTKKYMETNEKALDRVMGRVVRYLAPVVVGSQEFKDTRYALTYKIVQAVATAEHLHCKLSDYLQVKTDIHNVNVKTLRAMPPREFEQLLHPVFQEDEWILILLGGVLGVIVGCGQVYVLGKYT